MRRYELMMVLRADVPEDRIQSTIERVIRAVAGSGGQIVKVSPWGRRRLAYEIGHQREGSYHIVVFESPSEAVAELERGLLITEELLRHLVTRVERPVRPRRDGTADETTEDALLLSAQDEEDEDDGRERIDESESEAAPAATD